MPYSAGRMTVTNSTAATTRATTVAITILAAEGCAVCENSETGSGGMTVGQPQSAGTA